ncbi:MAG: winged helix-turn-helix domain-containing protein [Nocardioides sp.]
MATYEVDLRVGQPDEMRMFVGGSPLFSVLAGAYEMLGPGRYMLPREIVAAADRMARSLDLRALRPMLAPSALSAGLPHFLLEPAGPGFEPLSVAVERLHDTPADVIVEQVMRYETYAGPHHGLSGWATRARHELATFVTALSVFEREVFRPLVPSFEARLRTQVENLAIAVGTGQGPAVVSAIHPRLTRLDDRLRLPTAAPPPTVPPTDRSLIVYPMAASTTSVFSNNDADGVPLRTMDLAITVPALAIRQLPRAGSPPPRHTPLAALLGPGRSTVLTAIATSSVQTTRSLSTQLRMPPSTVSSHLAALKNAGLVNTARAGPTAVYRTTIAGRRILTAWD